mmetsp:Transcript_14401/g.35108  ORF Transcript_14401/g.35108 Transcript_14401/m.35108 type:complete len:143 (-) Transcript_14401:279-707(-)
MEGMNKLQAEFGAQGFTCLGIFCNQFGHQTNDKNHEILNTLKYVRPGKGYEASFPLFGRVKINGEGEHPLFTYLKAKLPTPTGEKGDLVMADPKRIIWSPVKRTDVNWNFEKFLIDKNGVPVKRFSSKTPVMDTKEDIAGLF